MTKSNIIAQLASLIGDRKSFLDEDGQGDDIYLNDISALTAAIEAISTSSELHPQVHVGRRVKIEDRTWWRTREWKVLDKVVAWMPLPEVYREED